MVCSLQTGAEQPSNTDAGSQIIGTIFEARDEGAPGKLLKSPIEWGRTEYDRRRSQGQKGIARDGGSGETEKKERCGIEKGGRGDS